MKKSLISIFTIVLIVVVFIAIIFNNGSDYYDADYNQDLLKLSENFDSNKISLCEEIPIEEIFIPNDFLVVAGRPFFNTDIENCVKIENVQQTEYGFNIIFKSQNQTLFIATNFEGQIKNMGIFGKKIYKFRKCCKIKEGMTLGEVKEIFPDSYFVTEYSEIFGLDALKCENPYIEIVCDNGTNFAFYFVEKNGVYYVDHILDYQFTNNKIIKSWKKIITQHK